MDLRDQLARIAGEAPTVTPAQLDADLTRGRRALRRRRTLQAAGGSAFAVAAVAAAMSFTLTGTATTPGGTAAGQPPAATAPASTGVKLVAFTGKQPEGFSIDKVPAGFFVQSDDEMALLLAPEKAKDQPDTNPSTNPLVDPNSYVGKIAIGLQSKDATVPTEGDKVDVGGRKGILFTNDGDDGSKTLWIEQQDAPWINVQFWGGIGLTDSQMLEIGAGVQAHEGAAQGVG